MTSDYRSPEPRRPFTMADLMILIAGLAIGISWAQSAWPWVQPYVITFNGSAARVSIPLEKLPWSALLIVWIKAMTPFVASQGMALLICRIRRPRPPIRQLALNPGAIAL